MTETAIFAGGCFWCTEAVFKSLAGVESVESGYIGGSVAHPTHKQGCSGDTGHAGAIRIGYDPAAISYDDLLDVFFATHDPTQLNRQGNDIGTQYRSAIFPLDETQATAAEANRCSPLDTPKFDTSRSLMGRQRREVKSGFGSLA